MSEEDKLRYIELKINEIKKSVDEKDKEIERLKEEKESWQRVATKNFNEAEDYKSIIKEVKEKIESVQMLGLRSGKTLIATLLNDILEMLNKGVDKE